MNKEIKAVILDFDGVFINRFTLHSTPDFCEAFNVKIEDFQEFSKKVAEGLDQGTKKEIDYFSAIISHFKLDISPLELQEFFHNADDKNMKADDLMFDFLAKINKTLISALLTNVSMELAFRIRKKGFYKNFKNTFFSYEMGLAKPDKRAFEYVLKSLGLLPNEVIFINDSQTNVTGAITCGIKSIKHTSVSQTIKEFEELINERIK